MSKPATKTTRAARPLALRRAKKLGAPLIEPTEDPSTLRVTFVCESESKPFLNGDFNDWHDLDGGGSPMPMRKLATGVWARQLTFPSDAYVEYCFYVDGKRRADPLNPRKSDNGMGGMNNFFYLPGAQPEPLAERKRGAPRGKITRHVIEAGDYAFGGRRAIHLYKPPVKSAVPLLMVLDGSDYLRRASICEIVDNLIAQKRIQPIALALVDNGGEAARFLEYACSDAHASFLTDWALPFARARLKLVDEPRAHGILGASMGGVMALYTALRAPHIFGKVLSQSGAFSIGDDHTAAFDLVAYDLIEHTPARPLKIYMAVGAMDWLLPTNRRMRDALLARGYALTYREFNGGHNYPSWRNDLARGLENLFG